MECFEFVSELINTPPTKYIIIIIIIIIISVYDDDDDDDVLRYIGENGRYCLRTEYLKKVITCNGIVLIQTPISRRKVLNYSRDKC